MPILRGEHAPAPSRLAAEGLFGVLPASRKMVVRGAGHMGPLTHASVVSRLIVRHTVASRREKARCVQSHRNSLRCLTPEQVRSAVNDPIQAPDFSRRLGRNPASAGGDYEPDENEQPRCPPSLRKSRQRYHRCLSLCFFRVIQSAARSSRCSAARLLRGRSRRTRSTDPRIDGFSD